MIQLTYISCLIQYFNNLKKNNIWNLLKFWKVVFNSFCSNVVINQSSKHKTSIRSLFQCMKENLKWNETERWVPLVPFKLAPLKQRQKWVKSNHNWLLQTNRGSGQDFESSEQGQNEHSLFLFDWASNHLSQKWFETSNLVMSRKWLHRCWWRMLETKFVGDNVEIFTLKSHQHNDSVTNIQKIVSNIMTPTSACHQHACSHYI